MGQTPASGRRSVRLEFERKAATKRARRKSMCAVQRHGVEVDEDSNIRGPLMSQIGKAS
jgi:hypothetical protein